MRNSRLRIFLRYCLVLQTNHPGLMISMASFLVRRHGTSLVLTVCKKIRERVVNGRDNIVRRGYSRRIRGRVYCIWKETKKWDSLAFRIRPVRTTLFRIQHLFSSDREHCVRGIAVCYPMVMSPTRIDSERDSFWGAATSGHESCNTLPEVIQRESTRLRE